MNHGAWLLQQSCKAMENGALLCNFQGDDGAGPDKEVRGAFLSDSDEALSIDAQELITSLQAAVDVSSTATHDGFYVNSKAVL